MALLTRILDNLACTAAAITAARVHDTAKRRILRILHLSGAMALRAFLRLCAGRCPRTVTARAVLGPRDIEPDLLAEGRLLERNLQIIAQIVAALRSRPARTSAATAEEHIENITEAFCVAAEASETASAAKAAEATGSSAAHAILEGRMAKLVVSRLLRI